MKIFKLALTGIGILMCIILVAIKKITGTVKQVQHITTFTKKDSTRQDTDSDELLVRPYCIPVNISY